MDDVSMLVPGAEENAGRPILDEDKVKSKEITDNFVRLGITQIVLGVAVIVVGILCLVTVYWDVDTAGEGIWGGIFVVICGSLCIAIRFHRRTELAWACLVLNIVTSVMLAVGVVFAAYSFFNHMDYDMGTGIGFMALNGGLAACLTMCIYLSVVFGKIINVSKRTACWCPNVAHNQYDHPYTMVYVPMDPQVNVPAAYMAAAPGQVADSAVTMK